MMRVGTHLIVCLKGEGVGHVPLDPWEAGAVTYLCVHMTSGERVRLGSAGFPAPYFFALQLNMMA